MRNKGTVIYNCVFMALNMVFVGLNIYLKNFGCAAFNFCAFLLLMMLIFIEANDAN